MNSKIKFVLTEDEREVSGEMTLEGDNISYYIEAFRYFLAFCGFNQQTIADQFKDE